MRADDASVIPRANHHHERTTLRLQRTNQKQISPRGNRNLAETMSVAGSQAEDRTLLNWSSANHERMRLSSIGRLKRTDEKPPGIKANAHFLKTMARPDGQAEDRSPSNWGSGRLAKHLYLGPATAHEIFDGGQMSNKSVLVEEGGGPESGRRAPESHDRSHVNVYRFGRF
jgi:hypothetical protein